MSSHKPTNTSKADKLQESALHKASSYGHGEVVKALVEAKANVDVQNRVRRGCGRAVEERRGRRGVHVMLCVAWWLFEVLRLFFLDVHADMWGGGGEMFEWGRCEGRERGAVGGACVRGVGEGEGE